MPTTYILHGGNTSIKSESNQNFFKEFENCVAKQEVSVLISLWSREKSSWSDLFVKYKEKISQSAEKNFYFDIANDPQDFANKIKNFDIFYVIGGDADNIEPLYSQLPDFKSQLEGKVYIGGSMGAFMVCTNYVLSFDQQDYLTVHKGLGILQLNLLCHWDIEKRKELKIEMLKKEAPDLPILTLGEGEYVKFVY